MLFTGCGGGVGDSQDNDISVVFYEPIVYNAPSTNLVEYQFFATIDTISGTPPFPVSIGDTVTGTFSLDPTVQDTADGVSDQGIYPQTESATVQVQVGAVTINADLDNSLGYKIRIDDNDSSIVPIRDSFMWAVNDTSLAASYDLDHIQVNLSFYDYTAAMFNSDAYQFRNFK